MMRTALVALLNDVPVRVNFPHIAAPNIAALASIGESQQISILKQPCEQGLSIQLPLVNHPPLIINQVNRLASYSIEQGIADKCLRFVQEQPDCSGGRRLNRPGFPEDYIR